MKKLLKFILLRMGYIIAKIPVAFKGKINSIDDYVEEFNKANIKFQSINESKKDYEIVKTHSMVPFGNLCSLYEQVRMIEKFDIEGDFVECGVWKGGSIGMMALANLKYGHQRRHLHLFDAFDDICEPDPKVDGDRALLESKKYAKKDPTLLKGDILPMKGFYDVLGGHGTIHECNELLRNKIKYDEKYIHFYKGWFQETFKEYAKDIKKISILRLDGDWYESTKLSLEYFYDKVQEGGIVIIDDYGAYEGCRRAVDEFFEKNQIKKFLINSYSLNPESYYLIK